MVGFERKGTLGSPVALRSTDLGFAMALSYMVDLVTSILGQQTVEENDRKTLRVENKKKWVLHMKQYYTHFHFRTLLKYYNRRTTQVEAFLIWEQYKTRKYSKCRTIKITLTEKEIHGSGDLFLQICESRVSQFLKRTFTSWSSMSPWYARFTGSLLC